MLRNHMIKMWLIVSALTVLLVRAEIRYICESEDYDGLSVLDFNGYARCGEDCRCVAVESLCMKGKYFANSNFSVVSVNYFDTCKDCVCNWWGTQDFWHKATAARFGLAVDLPEPTPVPAFSTYRKQMEKVKGHPTTFDRIESTDVATLTEGCNRTLTCELWTEADWAGASKFQTYPCDYLVFDVCYGSYACECSNGYTMTTGAMPSKDQKNLSGASELLDVDLLDPDNFPTNDYDLLKIVAFGAGVLLIVCSIPCICCVCCFCRKSKRGRIGCLDPRRRASQDRQQPQRREEAQIQRDAQLAANLASAEQVNQDVIAMYNSQQLYQSQHLFLEQQMPPQSDLNDHQRQAGGDDFHLPVDNRNVVLDLPPIVDQNPQQVIPPSVEIDRVPQEDGGDPFRGPNGDVSQEEIVNPQDLPGRVSLQSANNQHREALDVPQRHDSQISLDSNPRISAALPPGAMAQALANSSQQQEMAAAAAPQGNDVNREEANQNGGAPNIFSHGF